ncbi:MAG TPA: winged helix-turn-helix transcriptional regulator [Solirubrobacteraceae bacterium]|jgi:DNA-binding HxlR family transcriptional regulator|nr:winged helix-turn-helix transcriptional regulator [Solirubrobacteraceae bacterium]
MTAQRTYGDSCGIARALDVVGDRWALLVARELLFGPKRFSDLRTGLPRIGPDMLAQRVRELEDAGVVRRRVLPPPAASKVYELTEWGQELAPVLVALGRWGSRAPLPDRPAALSADAAMVALQTTFDSAAARGLSETYEVHLAEQVFSLRVENGRLAVSRGASGAPAAAIHTDTVSLADVLWHGGDAGAAIVSGAWSVEGDPAAAARLATLFSAPVPVGSAG